ncbi:MAG TPA: prenyltransferase/squalene oxidase repeat-containing protein [Verrucomicrobiae bacterium]|nr:prenyltransferase/squalene oxidase repeat-containing protein [Verrucomicrobiae bacterium]
MQNFSERVQAATRLATRRLLAERVDGHWAGGLSSSALSTATAVFALSAIDRATGGNRFQLPVQAGLKWLAHHINCDGGWGDTIRSFSNISTTALVWAAFGAAGADAENPEVVHGAGRWLARRAGSLAPDDLAEAITRRYGKDRTFSVPILTMCALGGRLGEGRAAWSHVLPLPFELAACPPEWFARLKLPVVSYALPALIAIGQARHHQLPSRNLLARWARCLARTRTLDVLQSIQPAGGGFLEATPLTSFVAMSLAASGGADHPVTRQCVEFLLRSVLPDGSWAIDTNLATWVTTLSVNALGEADFDGWSRLERARVAGWLLGQQYRAIHPYTQAAPGGWAWTDLSGGVPDADDTAGALLALRHLQTGEKDECAKAVCAGVTWLLDLQNADGGMPTFCRGWGALPFDRGSPDLTAHALRAWNAWREDLPPALQSRVDDAMDQALGYLARAQHKGGAWRPLWFGNQHAPDDENLAYGTARVLAALADLAGSRAGPVAPLLQRGAGWLVAAQNHDGSWGGVGGGVPSIEETALAVEALSSARMAILDAAGEKALKRLEPAIARGAAWLVEKVENGEWENATPIGFYFAKLWYYERLYPVIFTVGALKRAAAALAVSRGRPF